ncbi:MAG: hypothetical protein AB7U85_01440 [Alphaproteobacteria bacterium]
MKNQISEEINKLNSLIKTARNMTLKGTIADISAIKNNAVKLCDLIVSSESKKALSAQLEKIIENLDFLTLDLNHTFGWLNNNKKTDTPPSLFYDNKKNNE